MSRVKEREKLGDTVKERKKDTASDFTTIQSQKSTERRRPLQTPHLKGTSPLQCYDEYEYIE